MWIFRLRKVQIALAAVGVMVLVIGGLAILGRFSTVPEDERITVRPTSEEPEGTRLNEPTPEENPVVMPLPATDEPQELAASVAQVMGSPDTARFKEEYYVATIASAARAPDTATRAAAEPRRRLLMFIS